MRPLGVLLVAGGLAGGLAGCLDGIEPQVVAAIGISAPSTNLMVGQSVPFTLVATDAAGRRVSGFFVEWTSSNNIVATVTGQGIVLARGDGQTWIRARVGELRDSVQVTVTEPTTGERSIGR